MDSILSYMIRFLLGEGGAAVSHRVGYTANPTQFPRYNVVIIPSPFFQEGVYGTPASLPTLPLQEVEGLPLLCGVPHLAWHDDTLVVQADVIASAYLLLTRYEEMVRREVRDPHGRFPGRESLPYRAGFIHRPLVDEYGKLLRQWLRQTGLSLPEPDARLRKVWLTHDVDAPFWGRTLRSVVRETLKGSGLQKGWSSYRAPLEADPYYTFPWILEQNRAVREAIGEARCETILFIKPKGASPFDKPRYSLFSKDMQHLFRLCRDQQVTIGLHASYSAGLSPTLLPRERGELARATGQTIHANRHHYLCSREPEDMDLLEGAGITHDFTMGYADVAGFRLGTARPVRWINPATRRLSSLTLHPLCIMECTLSEDKYMGLSYEEALSHCLHMIEQAEAVGGDLALLWHNDSVTTNVAPALSVTWQRALYHSLTEALKTR